MFRQPVTSSNIRSIGYDAEAHVLEIEFHSGGLYQYFEVPQPVYDGLMAASSHGSFFHRYVRDRYRYKKIG